MTDVIVHEADREKHLVGLDIPKGLWADAEADAQKSGRWIYEIIVEWLILGHRTAKIKEDHLKTKKRRAA